MPATLVLTRYGESEYNVKNLFTGFINVPLSKKGEEEAKLGGERLKASNTKFE